MVTTTTTPGGSGTFCHQPFGQQFGVGHMGNKVSTKWVDQIDQITDIFKEVSIFVVLLGRFGWAEIGRRNGIENQS